jgi:hypothetical protein
MEPRAKIRHRCELDRMSWLDEYIDEIEADIATAQRVFDSIPERQCQPVRSNHALFERAHPEAAELLVDPSRVRDPNRMYRPYARSTNIGPMKDADRYAIIMDNFYDYEYTRMPEVVAMINMGRMKDQAARSLEKYKERLENYQRIRSVLESDFTATSICELPDLDLSISFIRWRPDLFIVTDIQTNECLAIVGYGVAYPRPGIITTAEARNLLVEFAHDPWHAMWHSPNFGEKILF